MKPIKFKEHTTILAEDQPEYQPLPVYQNEQEMISCWEFTFIERVKILFFGKLWIRQLTFGNLLQPQLPQVEYPFESKLR